MDSSFVAGGCRITCMLGRVSRVLGRRVPATVQVGMFRDDVAALIWGFVVICLGV